MTDKNYPSLKERMIVWNPGTDQVKIVNLPSGNFPSKIADGYKMSVGGCFAEVQNMSSAKLRTHVLAEAMTLIVRDKCDPMAVHKAFLGLREYRETCALDMPHYKTKKTRRIIKLLRS